MLTNSYALPCVTEFLSKGLGDPAGERPLDAAPAMCPEIAEQFGKQYPDATARALDSDAEWIATDRAFYYVWPGSGDLARVAWNDVQSVSVGRKTKIAPGVKTCVVSLQTKQGLLQVHTGPRAAKGLNKIYQGS